jgi:LysR family transcriptional regulator, glycine cleavage system transcriptional activator
VESSNIHVRASFDHYFLALPAAIGGLGHLVIPEILVSQALLQGLLVEVLTSAVREHVSYAAYVNPRTPAPEAARAFCRWLKGLLRDDAKTPDPG